MRIVDNINDGRQQPELQEEYRLDNNYKVQGSHPLQECLKSSEN